MNTLKLILCCLFLGFAWAQLGFINGVASSIPRAHAASAVVGTKIYLFGGVTDVSKGIQTASSQSFDTETGTWADLADMPVPVRTACALYHASHDNDTIYVFGGYSNQPSDLYFAYSISEDTWMQFKDSMPVAMYSLACVIDEFGYAFLFGITSATDTSGQRLGYNFETGALNGPQTAPVTAGASAYAGNVVSVVSGTSYSWLNPSDGSWQPSPPRDTAYYYSAIVTDDIDFFLFAGSTDPDDSASGTATIQQWQWHLNNWTTLTDKMPFSASGPVAARVGPSIYIFGGINENGMATTEATIVTCYYDVCECGCNAQTGLCETCVGPTTATPVAAPSTAPAAAPAGPLQRSSAHVTDVVHMLVVLVIGGVLY